MKSVAEVIAVLEREKLMVGSGDFYCIRALGELDIALDPGLIRLSFVHYTTAAEIEQLIGGLRLALE